MKPRNKGRLAPFVPMLKDTMKTEAWRALSYGARALYMALKARYNTKLQGAVYLSTRDAVKELSLHQCRTNIMKWFRELQYYGFIVMVSLPHHGVNGHGKAAHYRLTEEWYLGKAPTRDFLNWDGVIFQEQKTPKHYQRKYKSRGMYGHTTLECTGIPVGDELSPNTTESGMDGHPISEESTGMYGDPITSLLGIGWSRSLMRCHYAIAVGALLLLRSRPRNGGKVDAGGKIRAAAPPAFPSHDFSCKPSGGAPNFLPAICRADSRAGVARSA
jgi:hypothetical protein